MADIKLNCLVLGEHPDNKIFTIRLRRDSTISELKEMITQKKTKIFSNIDTSDLKLWRVDIFLRIDEEEEDEPDKDGKTDIYETYETYDYLAEVSQGEILHSDIIAKNLRGRLLKSASKISKVFPVVRDTHLNILVEPPGLIQSDIVEVQVEEESPDILILEAERRGTFFFNDLQRNGVMFSEGISPPAGCPDYVNTFLKELRQRRTLLEDPQTEYTIKYMKQKLGSAVFDEMFTLQKQSINIIDKDRVMAELSFFTYLIIEGVFINQDSSSEWSAADIEAHVTSKIVDPVMLRLQQPDDRVVKIPYLRQAPWYREACFGIRVDGVVYSYTFINDFNLLLRDERIVVPLLIGESESRGSPDIEKLGLASKLGLKLWEKIIEDLPKGYLGANQKSPIVILSMYMAKDKVQMFISWIEHQDGESKYCYHRFLNMTFRNRQHLAFEVAFYLYNFTEIILPKYQTVFRASSRQRAIKITDKSKVNLKEKTSFKSERTKRTNSQEDTGQKKRPKNTDTTPAIEEEHTQVLYTMGYDIKPRYKDDVTFNFINFAAVEDIKERLYLSLGFRLLDQLPVIVKRMELNSNEAYILTMLNTMLNNNKLRSGKRNHTIPILDVYSTQDCHLMVMPWYPVLQDLGKRDCAQYYNIRDQILEGVAFLHEHGIAHRDLNLNNIVWDSTTNRVFIIDFDLSLHLDPPQLIVSSSGTKGYLAPEVEVKGKPHDPFKADLWAMGVTLSRLGKAMGVEDMLLSQFLSSDPANRPSANLLVTTHNYKSKKKSLNHDRSKMKIANQRLQNSIQQCI